MKKLFVMFGIGLTGMLTVSCAKEDAPSLSIPEPAEPGITEIPKGFPPVEFPEDNAFSMERWELGKKLFFDPALSADGKVSCASCHAPEDAFADIGRVSIGVNDLDGTRNSPSLANIAYYPYFTREGGVPTLEMQVLVPIQEHNEFGSNIVAIAELLAEDETYVQMSQEAYDREPDPLVITRAIATFERTLISGGSAFDRYEYGGEPSALSAEATRGMELFFSDQTNCSSCHSDFNFTNYVFENNGLYEEYDDPGRFRLTMDSADIARFKVPSLHNIALTAPYMHDGSLGTLKEVIDHYNTGGVMHPHKSELIRPLSLYDQEAADLLGFLESLSDPALSQTQTLAMNKKLITISMLLITPLVFTLCKKDDPDDPVDTTTPDDPAEYDDTPYKLEYGAFPAPDFGDNPLTEEGVKLGRMLFYEKALSLDGSVSCGSCHQQEFAFTDPDRFSEGVDGSLGKRQAMSTFNTAWHTNEFFWDGRAHLLRDQSLLPIQDDLEMKETLPGVIAKLDAMDDYKDQFIRAFGDDEITSERMSLAMEQFMNSIVSYQSKYDQFLAGTATLTDSEERGRELFFAEYNPAFPDISGADCAHCHGGNNFDNNQYMNNGLDLEADQDDIGREEVTGDPIDKAKFKVTSLRNIELTAPYMHDGRFTTLEEVVDHYNDGIKVSPTVDPALEYTTQTGLMLTEQDKADLITFLKTLTDQELVADERYADPFE